MGPEKHVRNRRVRVCFSLELTEWLSICTAKEYGGRQGDVRLVDETTCLGWRRNFPVPCRSIFDYQWYEREREAVRSHSYSRCLSDRPELTGLFRRHACPDIVGDFILRLFSVPIDRVAVVWAPRDIALGKMSSRYPAGGNAKLRNFNRRSAPRSAAGPSTVLRLCRVQTSCKKDPINPEDNLFVGLANHLSHANCRKAIIHNTWSLLANYC